MIKATPDMDSFFAPFVPIMEAIACQFGENCEAVLHDLSQPQSSVIAIAGNLTGRPIGAPVTDYVLELLQRHGKNVAPSYHYASTMKDGRPVKASTTFLCGPDGEVRGCICINFCIANFLSTRNVIDEMCSMPGSAGEEEHYENDIADLMNSIMESVLGNCRVPVAQMDRTGKLEVVKKLELRGLFMVKGSVEAVAQHLNISKYTLYSYIDEIKGGV